MSSLITFLSDYGLHDDFVGVCHAVIAGICPAARIIDLTHGIPRQRVRPGALALRNELAYLPVGVHLVVVDPGVGSRRRAVALRTADGRAFVGPDNGVLSLAAAAAGGVVEAVDLGRSPWRIEPVSASFHGRDIFAPVAAHLAAGEPLSAAGEPLATDGLTRLELPRARREGTELIVHVLYVDGFGNVTLDADRDDPDGPPWELGAALAIRGGGRAHPVRRARTFADVAPGELLLYEDGYRMLALAVNQGSAAELLGVAADDDELRIGPA